MQNTKLSACGTSLNNLKEGQSAERGSKIEPRGILREWWSK